MNSEIGPISANKAEVLTEEFDKIINFDPTSTSDQKARDAHFISPLVQVFILHYEHWAYWRE